jgi:hypothetical protein
VSSVSAIVMTIGFSALRTTVLSSFSRSRALARPSSRGVIWSSRRCPAANRGELVMLVLDFRVRRIRVVKPVVAVPLPDRLMLVGFGER